MLFILHAGEKKKTARNANNEGEEELPGVQEMGRCWSGCFAGGAAVEEEGADSCRGEGKLSAGAVGVPEEGAATSVAAGRRWRKEDCCWLVKKLEGGGAPVEAVAAEAAAEGVAGAVEATVKEKLR